MLSFELCCLWICTTSVSDAGNKKAWQRRPAAVMCLWHIFSCLNLISLRQEFVQIFKMAKCPMHGIFICMFHSSNMIPTCFNRNWGTWKTNSNQNFPELKNEEFWIWLRFHLKVGFVSTCLEIVDTSPTATADVRLTLKAFGHNFSKFKYLWNSLEILSIAPNIPLSLWEPIDLDFSISCDMFGTNLET